jgi:hypothetical protein
MMSDDKEEHNIPSFDSPMLGANQVIVPSSVSGQSTLTTTASMNDVDLPPLKIIWNCPMIERCVSGNSKRAWLCKWCNKTFTPDHATRALKHVLKISGCGISVCSANVTESYLSRYRLLHQKHSDAIFSWKRSAADIDSSITSHQEAATQDLLTQRGCTTVRALPPLTMLNSFSSSTLSHMKKSSGSITSFYSKQPSIDSAVQNSMDIRRCNNASVEMAIADFFHCENIADRVVESPCLARLIKLARLVGNDFKMPSRKKISGELLDLNFQTVYNENKALLCRDASVFGLSFIGDGATIKRMPLLNILGLCSNTPPITIAIVDCTNHMQDGGKKDATYIASLFEAKVKEYDPSNTDTDVFFFDGASNVQKAGEVLMAQFPHAFCFHGGEHVVSLFFSSIGKVPQIRVRFCY